MVAPSDMMDGRVAVIRAALDREGYTGTPIMSYAVKYASSFYGPFREARGLRPGLWRPAGAIKWTSTTSARASGRPALDVEEGADIIMVKPAMAYLEM